MNTGTEEQNRDAFEEWYVDLVFSQKSALLRSIIRDNKKNLFKAWMERKPMRFDEVSDE